MHVVFIMNIFGLYILTSHAGWFRFGDATLNLVETYALQWRHNEHYGVSNHRPQLFIRAQIKENIKAPRHCPFVRGIHRSPVNSPHKWTVTRKMFPFDDVIMDTSLITNTNRTDTFSTCSYAYSQHIEAETKWTPFRRRHFQWHFLEWKCLNSD